MGAATSSGGHLRPFGIGSISLGLHPPEGVEARGAVAALLAQADAAARAGFDGVTISEHHAGFPGYIPQPLLVIVQILERVPTLWGGPAPTLLGLRSPRLLAEELAWAHAAYPGRFGAAVAAGYARSDFIALGAGQDALATAFPARLAELGEALSADGPLAADAAIQAWGRSPAPLAIAAASPGAARRAPPGTGILIPSGTPRGRLAAIASAYRDAGGTDPVTVVQQVWLGRPPQAGMDELQRRYDAAATPGTRAFQAAVLSGDADAIVAELAATYDAVGEAAVNLRVHLPLVSGAEVPGQVAALGAEVVPALREHCARAPQARPGQASDPH